MVKWHKHGEFHQQLERKKIRVGNLAAKHRELKQENSESNQLFFTSIVITYYYYYLLNKRRFDHQEIWEWPWNMVTILGCDFVWSYNIRSWKSVIEPTKNTHSPAKN